MSFDEILKSIARVTPEEVRAVASEFLIKSPTLAVVGPHKDLRKFERVLRNGGSK
jgi:predicted Zn-dependent peptidase